jgi:hypothetical protein
LSPLVPFESDKVMTCQASGHLIVVERPALDAVQPDPRHLAALKAYQDHGAVYFVALTRGDDGGSKQTRTADPLLVRQVL